MSDFRSATTIASCRGWRRSTTRTSRAAFSSRKMLAALAGGVRRGGDHRRDLLLPRPQGCRRERRARADPRRPRPVQGQAVDPGGLDVAGESETAFQTSAGEDSDAQLDLKRCPRRRSRARRSRAQAPPSASRPNETKEPVVEPRRAAPRSRPAARAASSSSAPTRTAQAERAWTALSTRFPSVKAMTKLVVPFSGGIACAPARRHRPTPSRSARRCGWPARTASWPIGIDAGGDLRLSGLELTADERRFLPRRRCRRLHPVQAQLRRPGAAAAADRRAARSVGPRRPADPDRPGRRPGGADAAAGVAGVPGRRARSRELYQAAPSSAIEAARSNARAIALMLRSCGINVEVPAAARRPPGRRERHHRRPRAGIGADAGRGAGPRGARRHGVGRRGRRDQAYPGPRPGAGRQPQGAAGGHRRAPRNWKSISSRSSGLRRRRWG